MNLCNDFSNCIKGGSDMVIPWNKLLSSHQSHLAPLLTAKNTTKSFCDEMAFLLAVNRFVDVIFSVKGKAIHVRLHSEDSLARLPMDKMADVVDSGKDKSKPRYQKLTSHTWTPLREIWSKLATAPRGQRSSPSPISIWQVGCLVKASYNPKEPPAPIPTEKSVITSLLEICVENKLTLAMVCNPTDFPVYPRDPTNHLRGRAQTCSFQCPRTPNAFVLSFYSPRHGYNDILMPDHKARKAEPVRQTEYRPAPQNLVFFIGTSTGYGCTPTSNYRMKWARHLAGKPDSAFVLTAMNDRPTISRFGVIQAPTKELVSNFRRMQTQRAESWRSASYLLMVDGHAAPDRVGPALATGRPIIRVSETSNEWMSWVLLSSTAAGLTLVQHVGDPASYVFSEIPTDNKPRYHQAAQSLAAHLANPDYIDDYLTVVLLMCHNSWVGNI